MSIGKNCKEEETAKIHEITIPMTPMILTLILVLALVVPAAPGHAADAAMGAKISAKHCAKCHGETGKGDGDALKKLKSRGKVFPSPSDWTNSAAMSRYTDEQLVKIIKGGGKAAGKSKIMPRWGHRLSKAEIADLVTYIRSLGK